MGGANAASIAVDHAVHFHASSVTRRRGAVANAGYCNSMRSLVLASTVFVAIAACSSNGDSSGPSNPDSAEGQPDAGGAVDGSPAGHDGAVGSGDGSSHVEGDGSTMTATGDGGDAATLLGCAPAPTSTMVVDAKAEGATGDGSTDDTDKLQTAIEKVAGTGGTLNIPDGTYMIDPTAVSGAGLRVTGAMTIRLSAKAVLKAMTNDDQDYAVMKISGDNVNVIGGTIEGDRAQHTGTMGQWGMGITLDGANHTFIDGVTAKEMWGDGFYVLHQSQNITFCNSIADHNRRQGMWVVSVSGLTVKNCAFQNTEGVDPQSGIDFEPNDGDAIDGVQILSSTAKGNAGAGFLAYREKNATSSIAHLLFDGNNVTLNQGSGISISAVAGTSITNNQVTMNGGSGLELTVDSSGTVVSGNTITGNQNHGIDDPGGNNMVGTNTVSGNGINP